MIAILSSFRHLMSVLWTALVFRSIARRDHVITSLSLMIATSPIVGKLLCSRYWRMVRYFMINLPFRYRSDWRPVLCSLQWSQRWRKGKCPTRWISWPESPMVRPSQRTSVPANICRPLSTGILTWRSTSWMITPSGSKAPSRHLWMNVSPALQFFDK